MADDAFEPALREDLPRGHGERAIVRGAERGLFARWLKPEEMQGVGGGENPRISGGACGPDR